MAVPRGPDGPGAALDPGAVPPGAAADEAAALRIRRMVRIAVAAAGGSAGGVWLLDGSHALHAAHHRGSAAGGGEPSPEQFRSLCAEAAERGALVVAPDGRAAAAPIRGPERTLGALWIGRPAARGWAAAELTLLSDVADAAADALPTPTDVDHRALAESHALLRAVVESSSDAIFAKDRGGRYLLANRAACEVLGLPVESILGRTDAQLLPADVAELLRAGDRHALQGDEPVTTEERFLDRIQLTSRSVYRDGRGEALGVIGVAQNVTESRRQEAVLRESEHRFRLIFDEAPAGVAIVRGDRVLFANRAMRRIFGYPDDGREITQPLLHHIAPEHRAPVTERMRRRIAGEPVAGSVEAEGLRPDGTRFPYHVDTAMVELHDGPAMVAFISDISERKQQEAQLRTSRELLSQVLETLPIGVWITDASGRIVFGNPAGQAIWGGARYVSIEDFGAGRGWRTDTGAPIAPHEWAGARAVRRGESVIAELVDIESFDGIRKTILNSAVPLRDEQDRIRGAILLNEDVTGRREQERELARSQEQLRQAQKMEAVGRLAGGVAHDFNNLLTAILSYAELLLADLAPGDPVRGDVEQIRQAGQRAADLTRQLLAFGRQQMLQPRPVSLTAIVADMDKMLRRVIGEDVELRVALAPELGTVMADQGQIEQVIVNLAVNARDAMPDGGVLTLETADVELDAAAAARLVYAAPGPYVRLAVRDTGHGMSPEIIAHVFEPFFTTKERGKGTGLGLSTVYGIVKQSGGSIFVESEPGRGSTFTIYLPRVAHSAEDLARPRPGAPVPGRAETILLVEDDALVRQLARSILARSGYNVLEAPGGAEALAICEQHPGAIDLLVTDVVMPKMSGPQLVRRLPARRAGMPVLFVSGYSDEAIRGPATLAPGAELLAKPFTPVSLTAKVREILTRPRPA